MKQWGNVKANAYYNPRPALFRVPKDSSEAYVSLFPVRRHIVSFVSSHTHTDTDTDTDTDTL